MPLVREQLHLDKGQVGNIVIASVSATIIARLLIGRLCDTLGPRLSYTILLVVGSIPVMFIGLSNSYESFLLFRLAIGIIGASFVITQFHTSMMFAPNIVGTANAVAGGWGNLGAGIANMVMPLVAGAFIALGLTTKADSWRYAMVVPGLILLVMAVLYSGNPDYPVNRGALCSKGLNLQYTVNDRSDRLLFPQMRYSKGRPLQRVSWDEALERTAAVFRTFIAQYGPDSVAFYASGQCLTEEYYVINKLIKGYIGSNNMDTNSRLCMSSAVVGYKLVLGEDSVPVCYDDIELADCFLVTGANPAWCHSILWHRVEAHKAANPATKVIVVDPRATDSTALADLHLQLIPGTDVVLHLGSAIRRIWCRL